MEKNIKELCEKHLEEITKDEDFQKFSSKILKNILWYGEPQYNKEEIDHLTEKLIEKYDKTKI